MSEAKIIARIVSLFFPFLAGVSFTRIYTLSKLAWYVAFAASLLYINSFEKFKSLSCFLAVLQIMVVFFDMSYYSDSFRTWKKHLLNTSEITWNEFYDENLFSDIKEAIGYNGENVCAVGYHPSVLLYNDFNTIDGYVSVYPYEMQKRWHSLMKPEFDRNPADMEYFDSWGGRRYIYNKEISCEPTREKYHTGVELLVDMDLLKNHYKCRYVLSRAELTNADEIGLYHVGTFDAKDSIYFIWVYEIE